MAANFCICIADESLLGGEFTNFEEVLRYINYCAIGSKYFNPGLPDEDPQFREKHENAWGIVKNTPSVWVGEVGWLSAFLNLLVGSGDSHKDIPPAIVEIFRLFAGDGLVLIDDAFIEKVEKALNLPNPTEYRLASASSVVSFLEEHKGKQCFVASWE